MKRILTTPFAWHLTMLITRGTVRRILAGIPLLLLPGMLLSVFRRADGMRFIGVPVMFLIGLIRERRTRVRAQHGGAHARGRAATRDDE